MMNTQYLGGTGLFTAIIIGLLTVDISYLCEKYNIKIKLSESVPKFLQDSFSAIIPLLINIIVFYGISLLLQKTVGQLIPEFIINLLASPLAAVNSLPGALFIVFITTLLWSVGLHGTSIIFPITLPIMIQATTDNAMAVASGNPAVFSPIFLGAAAMMIGGTGNTFALATLASRSKSKQLKAVGKASIIPGVFQVNEPLIFGLPVVFNPILAINFVFGPVLIALVMWLCY